MISGSSDKSVVPTPVHKHRSSDSRLGAAFKISLSCSAVVAFVLTLRDLSLLKLSGLSDSDLYPKCMQLWRSNDSILGAAISSWLSCSAVIELSAKVSVLSLLKL